MCMDGLEGGCMDGSLDDGYVDGSLDDGCVDGSLEGEWMEGCYGCGLCCVWQLLDQQLRMSRYWKRRGRGEFLHLPGSASTNNISREEKEVFILDIIAIWIDLLKNNADSVCVGVLL